MTETPPIPADPVIIPGQEPTGPMAPPEAPDGPASPDFGPDVGPEEVPDTNLPGEKVGF